jgi:hypothetical protein
MKPIMSESDKPLREQLDDAIAVVQRDLEILRSPSSIGGGADNRTCYRRPRNRTSRSQGSAG